MNYEVEKNSARSRNVWFKKNNRQKVLTMLAGWKDLTGKYNCTLTQLVIAWTVAQKGITYALCGARKPGHVLENVKAGDITPDETDISRMRKELIELGEPA